MNKKKRYAITGLSLRGIYAFLFPLLGRALSPGDNDFSSEAEIVAIVDPDADRITRFCQETGLQFPAYAPEDFTRMLAEQNPDAVIVTGPDFTHHDYIVQTLRAGKDVITEKPMVISAEQARSVLSAERESGRRIFMAHNYRYQPLLQAVKSMLLENRAGRVTNVEFTYNLDTFHGASYFFRWNRERAKSGGLNVHKCCHHFDLINWLLGDHPETLAAFGRLNYYGSNGAHRPRNAVGEPLGPAETKEKCPYFQKHFSAVSPADSNEISTGWDTFKFPYDWQYPATEPRYIYDEVIDIEDTYGVLMEYRRGAIVNYSCNFSTPWEGFVIGINGTEGRIEVAHHSNPDPTGKLIRALPDAEITFYPLFGGKEIIKVSAVDGGHGGADPLMQRDIFRRQSEDSRRLGLMATSYQGAVAVAQGEGVYRSLSSHQTVKLRDLLGEHYRAE
jgi:predicted dehydrogenase